MPPPPPLPPPNKLQHTISSHKGAVHTALIAGQGKYLLSGGADRQIRLSNIATGAGVALYQGHGYEVLGIASSKSNQRFASCGGDRSVFLWDVASQETIKKFQGHNGKVNAVAFNEEETVLASGSADMSVRLWDLKSHQRLPLMVLEEARDSITSIIIRGPTVIAASVDGHVRTYDLRQGELRTDYFDHPVSSLTLSADSQILLATTLDSTIRALNTADGALLQSFRGHANAGYRSKAAFGARERTVVFGDEDGAVWGWGLETGEALPRPAKAAHGRAILWTDHHPTARTMVTAGADGLIKVWGD